MKIGKHFIVFIRYISIRQSAAKLIYNYDNTKNNR